MTSNNLNLKLNVRNIIYELYCLVGSFINSKYDEMSYIS